MDQRLQFVTDHQRGFYTMTELCARHGVSRKTRYLWIAGFKGQFMTRCVPVRAAQSIISAVPRTSAHPPHAAEPVPDALIDRLTARLADRYRIERELGSGGMATV